MKELNSIEDYNLLASNLDKLKEEERISVVRHLCRTDLYFLLWFGCARSDIARPWLLARCKEVQDAPNNHLDLWSREHYKSTIITYGKTIQDILASHGDEPLPVWEGLEPTFGIFSCTRPLAKGFLRQIKREFETNTLLRSLFPDVIWESPHRDAPKWSEDDGIILKRKSNPKESTVESWGCTDAQPTSKHFNVLIYDDIVTKESVSNPEMINKVTESWELSLNLGAAGGQQRIIGTRYHFNDTYRTIISRGVATPRVYPATVDGTPDGEPVLIDREVLDFKRKAMGPYTFACQMLMNPVADETQGFRREWLRYHRGSDGNGLTKYILVDSANSKKKTSDYTVIGVLGLGSDQNIYILDMVRDRLNLTQRGDALFHLHRKWRPIGVGYESYALCADVNYMRERMHRENYNFHITELGGNLKKEERIRALIPYFEQGRVYLPDTLHKADYQGKVIDLVTSFIEEEFAAFPVCVHDDMLDCFSYLLHKDMNLVWPKPVVKKDPYSNRSEVYSSPWSA